ncbi:hypothetical protein Syun_030561 [Stephania yunnanensis]|uniref:Uncharacterized protein n=1 Tax=Stephania yunnanensis TaxID=152371 RepID=A0AAP0DXK8_9MAGN
MASEANVSNFSSPMPAIGLDIAGATLVCLILMLCDINLAFRRRKPWIPCRFFAINSFTLTLLSIATKLPVDLTTSMPSACDQLSKLCGTALLCISIGFFRPYIVGVDESELFANLASLTVIVVTIVVNISLQISTGAIFLFKVEHVFTLFLMLLVLSITGWFRSAWPECLCEPFRKSIKHMPRNVHTLKRCYMFSYITNPQLMHYRHSPSATVGALCTFSCVVLLQAAIRAYSLDHEVNPASDYKWSIWTVVGLQILTIIVGTFAVVFRCFMLASQMQSVLYNAMKMRRTLEAFHKSSILVLRNWSLYSRLLNNNSRVIFQIFRTAEYVHNFLLYITRIWADCVNELILVAIRVAGDRFAMAMTRTGISKCNRGDDDDDVETNRNITDSQVIQ